MADNDQEKTEQPTSRRREEAKSEGNVAVSKELGTLFIILGAVLVLYFASVWMATGILELMRRAFSDVGRQVTVESIPELARSLSGNFFLIIMPVLFIPVFGALAYVLQNGLNFSGKSLEPKLEKLNPIEGAKKIFSWNSISELFKSIIKITVIAYVAYSAVAKEWHNLPFLMDMETGSSVVYIARVTFRIMTRTVWVLVVIAAIDYAFQKWQHEKGLRMTREEVKEENKQSEGDPMVKARIKSMQREAARKRMMQDVPTADVVVTNPTHLSVALKYDKEKADAPLVVAKGAGQIAMRIREIARANDVPVIENKPLARSLYKHVEIGREIPATLYKAVAEMLAYVYRLKDRVTH